jgi:diphthamide biosynthesis methyltransferase
MIVRAITTSASIAISAVHRGWRVRWISVVRRYSTVAGVRGGDHD